MGLFGKLRAIRAFEKKHLASLQNMVDFDLVREIGYHQEIGTPLGMKQLYLLDVASVATVQRRLRRLKTLGAIHQVRSRKDARAVELALSARLTKTLSRYGELLRSGETES